MKGHIHTHKIKMYLIHIMSYALLCCIRWKMSRVTDIKRSGDEKTYII